MRISDWSSDVCSSDLARARPIQIGAVIEQHIDVGVAKERKGTHRRRAGHRAHGCGQWVGNLNLDRPALPNLLISEERRAGKECVRPGRSRWLPYPFSTQSLYK